MELRKGRQNVCSILNRNFTRYVGRRRQVSTIFPSRGRPFYSRIHLKLISDVLRCQIQGIPGKNICTLVWLWERDGMLRRKVFSGRNQHQGLTFFLFSIRLYFDKIQTILKVNRNVNRNFV